MNALILKCLVVLNLSLLLIIIAPKKTFAQIIYGFDNASHFNTSRNGPFSLYAGTFQSKQSAQQLKNKIASQISNEPVLASLPPITDPKNNSLSVQSKSSASKLRATILAGGSAYIFDRQGRVFFPLETFRTDSFKIGESKINFASALGIAYDKMLEPNKNKPWSMLQSISLGLNIYYNETSRNGSVYEYSLPDFNNATYNMNITSFRVMFDTEWNLHPLYLGVIPFVEAGIGGAQNTMSFKNIPRPNIGADGGNYHLSDYRNTQFAYEFGGGFKIPVGNHFLVSARYLFADANKANSGRSDVTTGVLLLAPITTKVQSQSVLLGLSYLFG